MKLESTLRDSAGFLYLAPLINVVLLLMLFFMLSSNFVLRSGVFVDTPTSSGVLPPVDSSHIITVTEGATPRIYFNEKQIKLEELQSILETARVETPEVRHVVIRGDAMAPYGVIITISDLVKQAQLELALATDSDS